MILLSSSKIFYKKTHLCNLKVSFKFFILFNIVSYIKLNFKLKIYPKMCTFKSLEDI